MANPVVFSEIHGRDGTSLRDFYGQLFGWSFGQMEGPMDYGVAETGEGGIPIGVGTAPDGGPGHVTFYVRTDDVRAALARVESLGGKTAMGAVDMPDRSVIATFADPEGHIVGLYRPA